MADPLQTLASTLTSISPILTALVPPAAVVVLGFGPRAGPGRAFMLAARSWFHVARKVSQRDDATSTLRGMLQNLGEDQYIVVTGQKGIGKSVVVDTATQRTCGVVSVHVAPGTSQEAIVAKALSKVANSRVGFIDPLPSVTRVLWWYGRFLPRPIVVLHAVERREGQDFADIPGAARELTGYGLRILIDGSTNSLPSETLTTLRQRVLDLEPMTRDILHSIPEYASLLSTLRKESLENVAWMVLGGVPSHFNELVAELKDCNEPSNHRRVLVKYLRNEIIKAISRRDRMLAAHPAMSTILDLFKAPKEALPESLLRKMGVVSPSPNKVLRVVLRDDCAMLVPADAAMALVLRHGFEATPSIEELMKLSACPVAVTPGPA